MNKVVKVLAIILLSIGVFVGVIFMLTSGITRVADQFFKEIKNDNIQAAYDLTDTTFKQETTLEELEAGIESYNLLQYETISWTGRSVEKGEWGERGELAGTLTYYDKTSIPLCMQFLKENKEWRIHFFVLDETCEEMNAVDDPSLDETSDSPFLDIPAREELIVMADKALGDFSEGVNQGDFTDFYENTISEGWRAETTAAEMNESFKDFLTPPIIYLDPVLEAATPVFSEPTIDEYGWLIVKGRYSTDELTIEFELDYTDQNSEWALSGIAVSTR